MVVATIASLPPSSMATTATLALPWTRIGRQGEGTPRRVSLGVVMRVVAGAIFVSICGMIVPRTAAAATEEAIAPITPARKRWDTMIPSEWSKKKHKYKNKNKINNSGGNIMAFAPEDSYACAAATSASAYAEAAAAAARG
jgi:hypothetical protein